MSGKKKLRLYLEAGVSPSDYEDKIYDYPDFWEEIDLESEVDTDEERDRSEDER